MSEEISIEALTLYLESHPLVAVLLAVLTIMLLGSLIRMLVRVALILALVLVLGLYWTHQEAAEDWDVQAEMVKRKAAEYGKGALEIGKILLEKGGEQIKKQLDENK
ncbi:MAG: fatty acid desaturase [Candidatus Latescibacterota bacterium]|jgi:fatty acid desaturase